MSSVDLTGRTCLVTGASSGIGEETALALARAGARVGLVCRSRERAEASRARIARECGSQDVDLFLADLSSQKQIRRVAEEILAAYPRLHVLVNNAGVVNLRRTTTEDGIETTFAVNHLAYFLLTQLLLDRLRESAPARIVNVASEAHRFGRLDLDDLNYERSYGAMRTYGGTKLANILFTAELARRLEGSGVTANCVHPGPVGSRLATNNGVVARIVMRLLSRVMPSPERGARTQIWAATAPELDGVSGRYFAKQREAEPSAAARDHDAAARLWEESRRLTDAPAG